MRHFVKGLFSSFIKGIQQGGFLLFASFILAWVIQFVFPNWHFLACWDEAWVDGNSHLTPKFFLNEGLMTFFFLLAGLEIRREFIHGSLKGHAKVPMLTALGGMIFPALIFLVICFNYPELRKGWAIATATDISFSIALLSLFGKRVSPSFKALLVSIAVADDLGAMAIIALFYQNGLHFVYLSLALVVSFGFMFWGPKGKIPFVFQIIGLAVLWFLFLHAGLNPTLSGVIIAFSIPYEFIKWNAERVEEMLLKPVNLIVIPLFVLANSVVVIQGNNTLSLLTIAVFLSLVIGKFLGISLTYFWVVPKKNIENKSTIILTAVRLGFLCGIGFTMSLFISVLAFPTNPLLQDAAKIGVLIGSFFSACAASVLFLTFKSSK